jgi:hypothetical protein
MVAMTDCLSVLFKGRVNGCGVRPSDGARGCLPLPIVSGELSRIVGG